MRSRSRPEWLGGSDEEDVLPAVSTSSLAFQAVLDDLVRAVDAPDLAASAAPLPSPEPSPVPTPVASPSGESWLESAPSGDVMSQLGGMAAPSGPESPSPSGESLLESVPSGEFMSRLDGAEPAGPPPARLRGRGDLTLVVGLGPETEEAARVLAASADAGAEVQRVADRRDALAARADGVRREIPIVASFPLAGPGSVPALAADLAAIAPDQVWVAVDVSRKHDDTAEWVRAVDAVLAVDAVAATGASVTLSPESVHGLGLPVLWLDAPPGG